MTIGVLINSSGAWLGGTLYAYQLVASLKFLPAKSRPKILLFHPDNLEESIPELFKEFPYVQLKTFSSTLPLADRYSKAGRFIVRIMFIAAKQWLFNWWARKYGLSVLFPALGVKSKADCSFIPCIYDFQHRYFPGNFSPKEIKKRDDYALRLIKFPKIAVISESVKNDYLKFFKIPAQKIKVVHPSSYISDKILLKEINKQILKKYSLPERYFYCGNQFWKHKNHLVLFKAFNTVKHRQEEIVLVCTGAPEDYRWPDYICELKEYIVKNNLEKNILLLGLIPREDQLEIMKASLAVIQPSLFEGWSGSVADAQALGKKIILSDLPVHREFELGENGIYFNSLNCQSLAEIISGIWKIPEKDTKPGVLEKLQAERMKKTAGDFMDMIK